MRDALVFSGASHLDFQDIRTNVVRIPEVISRIREAQAIWDTVAETPLDLANFLGSEDSVFLGHIRLKSFATAVVQVGLLDRYLKTHKMPEFVVGVINSESPMKVAIGQQSFFDLVSESPSTGFENGVTRLPVVGSLELPVLSGVQIAEYAVFQREAQGEYQRIPLESREIEKMILDLVEKHEVRKLIMVGPGSSVCGRKISDRTAREVQVLESIDLDPMLSWFWSYLKGSRLSVAN